MADACAGALLAVGILNCGLQHENDPAYALLHDFVDKQDPVVRIGAIMGLGLAYAGTQKEEVRTSVSAISDHSPIRTCSLDAANSGTARSKPTHTFCAAFEADGTQGAEHCTRALPDCSNQMS